MAGNTLKPYVWNNFINLNDKKRSILIYVEDAFNLKIRKRIPSCAKTADGILRYAQYKIVGIIDSKCEESHCFSKNGKIFIFKNLKQAKEKTTANTLIIGVAPEGGQIPKRFLNDLRWALENGIDIVSGMHTPLCSFPQLKKACEKHLRKIWETRIPPNDLPIASCRVYQKIKKPIVLTIGTDAAIGKLTATYELAKMAKNKGLKTCIIPTGQTAIMIEGWGIAVDKCEGDFMAGAVEKMILEKEKDNPDIYFVEGQGSLFHPAYSTTSLALIHGSCPTHLVLVHRPQRKRITGCQLLALPEIKKAIFVYEKSVLPNFRKTKVVAIALNTQGLDEKQGQKIINEIKKQTGLPTADLLRWPPSSLMGKPASSADKNDWTNLFNK